MLTVKIDASHSTYYRVQVCLMKLVENWKNYDIMEPSILLYSQLGNKEDNCFLII